MPTEFKITDFVRLHPTLWSKALESVSECVKQNDYQKLGELRVQAHRRLTTTSQTSQRQSTTSNLETNVDQISDQLVVYAVDQFADALTGKIGTKAKLRDRLLFDLFFLRALNAGRCPNLEAFDRRWHHFKDPFWASGEVQRQGFWSIPTKEFLLRIKDQINGRRTLEIGAGRGLLTSGFKSLGVEVLAIDDLSWTGAKNLVQGATGLIQNQSALDALKTYQPEVVIASWPTPSNEFEDLIFKTKSVQLYLAINSKHSFASGNWQSYKNQKTFSCSTSEPLNQLLRPRELEQAVLIFRRT